MANPRGAREKHGRGGSSAPPRRVGSVPGRRGLGEGDRCQQQAGGNANSHRGRWQDDDLLGAVGGGQRCERIFSLHRPGIRGCTTNTSFTFHQRERTSADGLTLPKIQHSLPSFLKMPMNSETLNWRGARDVGNPREKGKAHRSRGSDVRGRGSGGRGRGSDERGRGSDERGNGGRGTESDGRDRGNGRQGRGHDSPHEIHKMGYKTLEGFLEKDESEVAITLTSRTGFKLLLEERTMRFDLVQLLCRVLHKAFQARIDRNTVMRLAQIIKDSQFFQLILPHHVNGMMFAQEYQEQYPQHLSDIISLLLDIFSMFPQSSILTVSMVTALLKTAIDRLRDSEVDILESTDEELKRLEGLVTHYQKKPKDGKFCSRNYLTIGVDEDTPLGEQDFREISIYPTYEEFHDNRKPFLRGNMISQSFPTARIYLDTHFRLLREDFVRPLRDGVKQILGNAGGKALHKMQFDDVRIYEDTHLLIPLCTSIGISYKVQFNADRLKFVRWENSKRLIYGSLVCLSMDNFETFLFATVADRDPKLLKKGQVNLSFSPDSRQQLVRIRPTNSFLMVETTAYFEAYRYVLEGLQEQDENKFPFQRYIVECRADVDPPAYLLEEGRSYDLSCIAVRSQRKLPHFNPLSQNAWPDEEQLGLDESQFQALKLALTNELAIIQGPPGTGKTYVGLKIARALLENHNAWSHGGPMLVVCYTNHALDQFLEGIFSFLRRGIVRVGGRSSSEILKPFSLRQLTRGRDFNRNLPQHLRIAYEEVRWEMTKAEESLKELSAKLECVLRGIIKEEFLERFMEEEHWNSLMLGPVLSDYEDVMQMMKKKKFSMIAEWLGVGFSVFEQRLQEEDEAEETGEEDVPQVEEEDLIEVEEEADFLRAERMLQDVDDCLEKDQRKQKQEQSEVDALVKSMLALDLNSDQKSPGDTKPQEENEWQIPSKQKKKIKANVKKKLQETSYMDAELEQRIGDIWSLSLKDRWSLYRLWIFRYSADLRNKTLTYEEEYQQAANRLSEVRRHEDLTVLSESRVVGMTTTGAAKYRQVLQQLRPRLVIVEEAAEVLEAHTITTLSQACQHLILIGDHQQLRPSATVYELAKNFSLEVSMFERLVKMDFPFVRLNYQHRMRPCIARLLTPHIYESLENHPSVLKYESIKGVLANVFFVKHSEHEDEIKDGRTRKNTHEAQFVVALCKYLLLQEYEPSQITILTTYSGQLYCLRNLMPSSVFSGVKVHVVDKYQGEENDIIILSLVRSNIEKKVGFLNIPNRVCVALSRAKKGLYCIGDMTMLSAVPLWKDILCTLQKHDQVGEALILSCQNHPDKQIHASCAKDFLDAPEGGCNQPCEFRLECGHVCTWMCHPYDADHKKFKCMKACPKVLCELEHKCPLLCHQKCGECTVLVEKIIPTCQHNQKVPCHQDPEEFKCKVRCVKTLACGHPCKAACGDSCTSKCMVKVPMELKCGHMQMEPCFVLSKPTQEPRCLTKCGAILKCGHACPGTCYGCNEGCLHKACAHKCKQILVCSHECPQPCVRDCPPCSLPCQNRCFHSICKKSCGEPCVPCREPCIWQCPHQSCTKLCCEPCDRPPCSVPCAKTLPCGHPCIGLCGELCPRKCRICDKDEVMEIFFGDEDEPDACFIQLEDCKHLFESTGMDRYMIQDEDQAAELDQRAIRLKDCPRCRTPIRRNLRYGTHINRSLAAIEMVKEKISGLLEVIRQQQIKLDLQLQQKHNLRKHFQLHFDSIEDKLMGKTLSHQQLWHLENLTHYLDSLGQLKETKKSPLCQILNDDQPFPRKFDKLLKFLLDPMQRFSEQQVSDLDRELKRLSHLAELNERCRMSQHMLPDVLAGSEVQQLREILENNSPFSEDVESRVNEMFIQLDKKLPRCGLRITNEERVMIIQAMALNKGHWYKCPNGHVYAIGECGGAMVKGRCPECSTDIGGTNHTLTAGNALASEMDGAQYAAWSDAANMANFDLRELDN